ncbi:MAG: magnesium and cobalt transport protein CorA [Azoarcus sp.]|nr:magnesium and cobalt transport protein CorA [Azoarcus sp.]
MLIHCTAYRHGKKLADLPLDEASDYLSHADCFVWVALRDANTEELAQMQAIFGLHELAVEDANHGHQRPKIEEYDDSLFAVMHLPEEKEAEDAELTNTGNKKEKGKSGYRLHVGEIHVFIGPRYIVSIQNGSRQNLSVARARCERDPENLAHGSGYVFYTLMDTAVDSYFPLLEKLETAIEVMEERIFTHGSGSLNSRGDIRRLYRLKRHITVLKHAVTPLMEAAGRLHSGRVPEVCRNSRHYFRDVYDHLLRLNSALDSMRDTVTTAIQVNLALIAINQTEISKRLAAWAGIFAIVTALVGVWGMNFVHMPELQWEYGYAIALGFIATSASVLYWRFRRAGWL